MPTRAQIIPDVFRAYGIEVSLDESIRAQTIHFDIDDASFYQATHALSMVTKSFFEAIDPHRAVVALDTRENRSQFIRNGLETVYLSGMTHDGDDRHWQHGEECVRGEPVGGRCHGRHADHPAPLRAS